MWGIIKKDEIIVKTCSKSYRGEKVVLEEDLQWGGMIKKPKIEKRKKMREKQESSS
jgi:hypothetical protein